ncbi:hypothetical protein P7D95_22000, partial [Enterococcus avium]|uniref:hypothetical protein n=1 Tax=Enterococcus avium TaxID=33945 RepID=UPI0028901839
KIRNEVDKKLFQARVTSLEQLLSTVWEEYFYSSFFINNMNFLDRQVEMRSVYLIFLFFK